MELSIVDKIIGAIVAVLIVTALLPTLFTALSNTATFNWSAITLGTTVYNFGWVPFVIGLLALVGVVYFLVKHFKV